MTLFRILFLFIFLTNISMAKANNIAFVDMERLLSVSLAGKSIISQIDKQQKANSENFKKKQESLKKDENTLIGQKNVLSPEQYKEKLNTLTKNVNEYNKTRNISLNNLKNKQTTAQNSLLEIIGPILTKYSDDNSISIIFQKKYILIGKKEQDITKQILTLLDKKIQTIKLK